MLRKARKTVAENDIELSTARGTIRNLTESREGVKRELRGINAVNKRKEDALTAEFNAKINLEKTKMTKDTCQKLEQAKLDKTALKEAQGALTEEQLANLQLHQNIQSLENQLEHANTTINNVTGQY